MAVTKANLQSGGSWYTELTKPEEVCCPHFCHNASDKELIKLNELQIFSFLYKRVIMSYITFRMTIYWNQISLVFILSEFHYLCCVSHWTKCISWKSQSVWPFSIHSASAYAIPLNPYMLFIFSIAFGRLRFLYQWPDMSGYRNVVFLFWHRHSVFSYTILTSNTGYVICKGHLWRSTPARWWLGSCRVRPNNTGPIDCGMKKWHKSISLQCCLFQEGWCEVIFKLDLLLI